MKKRDKIIYWVATIWLASAMVASGIQQLLTIGGFVEIMDHLGYPTHFSMILGAWKLLGVIAILIPGYPLIKEWAYAGFFFAMSGAIASYVVMGDGAAEFVAPSILLVMMVVSWYFRPEGRKLNMAK
ncbi:MAG: DoxX family protein [Flavobacteriales bacterium]